MWPMLAPSVASLLRYLASNLPPKICSKSLFSSMTITMWSYTGSVEGQDNLFAAAATTLEAHVKRAMAHTRKMFCISVFRPGSSQERGNIAPIYRRDVARCFHRQRMMDECLRHILRSDF